MAVVSLLPVLATVGKWYKLAVPIHDAFHVSLVAFEKSVEVCTPVV